MEEDQSPNHLLRRPLIPKEKEFNPLADSNPGIIFRIAFIFSIGLIAVWANHEASKGFDITVINDATGHDGRCFDVFYVATDRASSIVYTSSMFVEHFMYPNETYIKKQVKRVILRMSSRNLTESVNVESHPDGEYVMYISPSVMTEMKYDQAMHIAVQKGMARIWIYDGLGGAPTNLVDGIVEYISSLAISGHGLFDNRDVGWSGDGEVVGAYQKSNNTTTMVEYLNYHEWKKVGFIRRLNQNLRNQWQDWMVDDTAGSTGQRS